MIAQWERVLLLNLFAGKTVCKVPKLGGCETVLGLVVGCCAQVQFV